jgi:DNA-binding transcriptional ArsR family regulator
MEKYIHFTKESDYSEWIKMDQNLSRYRNIPEYEEIIKSFQSSSVNFSNRSTKVENFSISYDTKKTISERLGIIRYSFVWKNFSYNNSGKIYVGDAFPGGVLFLSPDNQLIIRIPEGYNVTNVTPVFDKKNGNLLIWDGTLYSNFSDGEPFVELSRTNATNLTGGGNSYVSWLAKWPILVLILFSIMVLLAFVRLWEKKRSGDVSTADIVTQVPREMLHEISEIPVAWTKIVQSVQREFGEESIEELEKAAREQRLKNIGIPLSELSNEDLEDEEMIKQFLLRSGGQAYQTNIVEHSGLSKSKISMVLSKMKDDGMIIKIRKGKENLIRLVKEINEP